MRPDFPISAQEVRGHVEALAGRIGQRNIFVPEHLHEAATYIREVWQRHGYTVTPHCYRCHGIESSNLVIERRGARSPEAIWLVGAHYDTVVGSPGADDNASGIAALLAMAGRLADTQPAHTIRMVAFVNEEPPFFATADQGSLRYARAARERGDAIQLMVALEMLGYYRQAPGSQWLPPVLRWCYPDSGDFVGLVGNLRSAWALHRFRQAFKTGCSFPIRGLAIPPVIPGIAWSDHAAFWQQGYRALMVTDTAFYRNPHYHTPDDRPETLDYEALARVAEGLCRALASLTGTELGHANSSATR